MKIIRPSFKVENINGIQLLQKIEYAGRVCYKSEDKITEGSCKAFAAKLVDNGHEAMLEHASISVKIICDRGVSHELVRHRLASYAQESTRYCNYSKSKFGSELTFIIPSWISLPEGHVENLAGDWYFHNNELGVSTETATWLEAMLSAERTYLYLIQKCNWTPQQARSVLPNSLKTEVVVTMNIREWRHFFTLRASEAAHPQMQELSYAMLAEFQRIVPVVFDDLGGVKK